MKKKKAGQPSELMDLLIAYKHEDMFRIPQPKEKLYKIGRIAPETAAAHGGK